MNNMQQQSGNFSKNVQIGQIGESANVSIVQSEGERVPFVKLQPEDIQEFSRSDLLRDTGEGLLRTLPGVAISAVGFWADSIGLSQHFGFPVWLPAISVGILAVFILALRYLYKGYLLLKTFRIPFRRAVPVGWGYFLERDSQRPQAFLYYRLTAPCIYPECQGKIVVVPAPPKEQLRRGLNLAGICSVAGKVHSYQIDPNRVARPSDLDWSPIKRGSA